MLKRITGLGITYCAVIHQPRQEIFDQLDDVILLASGGHQLYSGPAQDLIPAMRAQVRLFVLVFVVVSWPCVCLWLCLCLWLCGVSSSAG